MKHSIDDVRGHLFAVLERLQDVDFCRVTGGTGSGFIENTGRNPSALRAIKGDAA